MGELPIRNHNKNTKMSEEENKSFQLFGLNFPVYQSLIVKWTMIVWVTMLMVLLLSTMFFQYEMTNADLPCGAVAGVLLAYLITLIIKW